MKFAKIIFTFMIVQAFCLSSYAMDVPMKADELPAALRRLEVPISEEQYQAFENAKKVYFKNFGNVLSPLKSNEIPLFEVTGQNTESRRLYLGTNHDVPLEVTPIWLFRTIEEADEVYLESEFITVLRSASKSEQKEPSLDGQLLKRCSTLLDPLLSVFSTSVSQLPLQTIFNLVMRFDAYIGMDSTISMRCLRSKKPVYLLDVPYDPTTMNLRLLKEQMTQMGKKILNIDEDIMRSYIKEEVEYLFPRYMSPSSSSESKEGLKEDLAGWLDDGKNCLKKGFLAKLRREPEYKSNLTEERNVRWFGLLHPNKTPTNKLVCVGTAHLPDLFERHVKAGDQVRNYIKK